MNGHHGTVTHWAEPRRYGFIRPDASGPDIFVHFTALIGCKAMTPGSRVSFEIGTNPTNSKTCAVQVAVLPEYRRM